MTNSFYFIYLAIPVWGWNVTILNITPNSLTLQWTKLNTVVNHYATFYIVEVKSTQGTILTVVTTPKNVTTKVIKRLSPSKKYRVSVFGVDGIGQPYKSLEGVATTGQNIGERSKTHCVFLYLCLSMLTVVKVLPEPTK